MKHEIKAQSISNILILRGLNSQKVCIFGAIYVNLFWLNAGTDPGSSIGDANQFTTIFENRQNLLHGSGLSNLEYFT